MQIIGRLTKDAEVRNLSMEKKVVNFSVAVNNRYTSKSGEKQEVTTFYDCSYWISEKVAPFLKKGGLVEVSGRVSARAWTGKDGEPRASLNLTASQITFHDARRNPVATIDSGSFTATNQPHNYSEEKDDLPF